MPPSIVVIDLETKFSSVHFEKVISSYWKSALRAERITFDLSRLEWIAIEQVTFFISWVNHLTDKGKSVSLILPNSDDVSTESLQYKKRQRCVNHLLIDWGLLEVLDPKVIVVRGIMPNRKKLKNLPYKEVNTISYDASSFDSDFYELYDTDFTEFTKYIGRQIKENTLLSYFDNHFLHYSLIKEFYSNACQHAFQNPIGNKCFISLDSNSAIQNSDSVSLAALLNRRYLERPAEEQVFFRNEVGEYLNNAFIEFNFSDFGVGIVSTLREKYLQENISSLASRLSSKHSYQNEDSRILEYAFLLFTSKYELGKDFEMHDYIPRGLYIIKDIVRRYNGMIIARSRKGKVIFNFSANGLSDEVVFREDDFASHIGEGFPGTSITIVLPSRQRLFSANYRSSIREDIPFTTPHIISVLKYANDVANNEAVSHEADETKKRIKFLEEFFKNVVAELISRQNAEGSLCLIDFAGVERNSQDIFSKFVYFIAYCPLISDSLNVCLINVVEKGIADALSLQETAKKSRGFFSKVIPCLYPDLSVEWIGVGDKALSIQLTQVWKQDFSRNKVYHDIHHLHGNVVDIIREGNNFAEFTVRMLSFYDMITVVYEYHHVFIETELTDKGLKFNELCDSDHNYNLVFNRAFDKITGQPRAFLTSNGIYQKEFFTFIEKLYIREYRRLIATFFIYNLHYDNYNIDGSGIEHLTKVLTVTLSSQLLGKEVMEIINELSLTRKGVSLIPLSNYYDFNVEEPFNEVSDGDIILIVNDVISTGNLSRKLIASIEERQASIFGVLTIIDSRSGGDSYSHIKSKLTALCCRPVDKYVENPFKSSPIWVNPILNAPTTMSKEKSNRDTILKSAQEFVNFFKNDDFFKIGYFKQNTRYLTYYLQTDDFFNDDHENGFPVLNSIIDTLKLRASNESRTNRDSLYGDKVKLIAEKLSEAIGDERINFEELQSIVSNAVNKEARSNVDIFIDFVFYPFLSSVSVIEKNLGAISNKFRGDKSIEVFPLPRIMTPRGWRFSFPPKFLNFHARGKTALILDDGSCTGETIIQMIDSLSFLELNEIYVLSIFGRLEDFQREFMSRIKQVRVKDSTTYYKDIPVRIFFGTHFHIPIYTKTAHPFFVELRELEEIERAYISRNHAMPAHLKSYIDVRRLQIGEAVNPRMATEQATIIPAEIVRRLMFVVRDILGNYDSYRLFKEDEISFNETTQSQLILSSLGDILRQRAGKLAIIAVLVIEPHLVDTIKRIYPELISDLSHSLNLLSFISTEIIATRSSEMGYFLAVGLNTIDYTKYFDFDFLVSLLEKVDIESHSLNYIGYVFSAVLLKTRTGVSSEAYNSSKKILQKLYIHINNNSLHDKKYSSLIKELYNESLLVIDDFPENKNVTTLLNVQQYYQRQVSNHNGRVYSSHPNYYASFESIINRLGVFAENEPSEEEKAKLHNDLLQLVEVTQNRLLKDLRIVLKFLEPLYLNYDFEIDIPSHIKLLDEYKLLNKRLKDEITFKTATLKARNRENLLSWLDKFNESFFHLKSQVPSFFILSKTNLLQLVNKTIQELRELNRHTQIELDIPNDISLEINPYLLRLVFYEIFQNQYKHASSARARITYEESYRELEIRYLQNESFKADQNENGLITIRNIVSHYGGTTRLITTPTYEFLIKLPKFVKFTSYFD